MKNWMYIDTIDQLGIIRAQIAELQAEEKVLKDKLIAAAGSVTPWTMEGERFRVAISTGERSMLDMDAVREKLSPQFIRAHTNVVPFTQVRVSARKVAA